MGGLMKLPSRMVMSGLAMTSSTEKFTPVAMSSSRMRATAS